MKKWKVCDNLTPLQGLPNKEKNERSSFIKKTFWWQKIIHNHVREIYVLRDKVVDDGDSICHKKQGL